MSFPADVISAAVALDLGVLPAVLGRVALKVLSDRQAAPGPVGVRIPALRPQEPAERPAAVIPASGSMPRRDAARALGIGDRDAQGLVAAGVLAEKPWIGRVPQVAAEDVNALLAARNGSRESAS